jgi:hypothetical protein
MGAKSDWVEIYDSYSDVDLASEITLLKERIANPYVTQSEGQRGYTRSTVEDRSRLSAAVQIQRERSTKNTPRHGVADFSQFR